MQQSYRPQSRNNFKGIHKYCSFSEFCFLACSGGILFASKCGTIAFIHPETSGFVLVGRLRSPAWQTALENRGACFMPAPQCFRNVFATFVLGKCRGLRGGDKTLCAGAQNGEKHSRGEAAEGLAPSHGKFVSSQESEVFCAPYPHTSCCGVAAWALRIAGFPAMSQAMPMSQWKGAKNVFEATTVSTSRMPVHHSSLRHFILLI